MTLTKAVMKALGCRRDLFRGPGEVPGCRLHRMGWDVDPDECKRAQEAARRLEALLPEVDEVKA